MRGGQKSEVIIEMKARLIVKKVAISAEKENRG